MNYSPVILLIVIHAGIADQFKCGVPQQRTIELIVRGSSAAKGRWPWHVAIFHKNHPLTAYVCGGTLISASHVLTAAHCLINPHTGYQLASKRFLIEAGAYDLNLDFRGRQRHLVRAIHKTANYSRASPKHDIAILELDSEVELNQYVHPACVYLGRDLTGKMGTVIGWGVTENNEVSSVLKQAELPVIDTLTCLSSNRYVFGPTLDRGMFCAGYVDGTSVCNGDSGGGMFFKVDGAWHVAGIVSFKQVREENKAICRTDGYAVFTKIYDYLPWISSVTKISFWKIESREAPSEVDHCRPVDVGERKINTSVFPRNCGIYTPNRIIYGSTAKVFEFPWMAILLYNDGNLNCAGTLINRRYVLTSASCLHPNTPEKVRLGEHTWYQNVDCNDKDDCAPPVRDYDIECVVKHQNYNDNNKYNIGLIRLRRKVLFEDHIQPICLPLTAALRTTVLPSYIITGWGTTEHRKLSLTLRKATILAVGNHEQCQKLFSGDEFDPHSTYEDQFCTASEDSPAYCYGDAGGPLGQSVRFNGMRFVQFGIFSNGWGRCNRSNTVFTKVGVYMDWILANVKP